MRKIIGTTDTGLVRETNQDRYKILQISEDLSVAAVCDGMGGKQGGGIAAQLAVDFAKNTYNTAYNNGLEHNINEATVRHFFATVFAGANTAVYNRSLEDTSLKGMGTTMVMAIIHQTNLYIGWVGDSRAYLVSKDEERQLTKDHTIVQHMVDHDEITPEEALVHPQKHYITRAVGVSDEIEFDFLVESFHEGDMILICSDGLYSYLEADTFYHLLATSVAENSAENLIQLANQSGGSDNITAVIMI